jgi:hypothetical protein
VICALAPRLASCSFHDPRRLRSATPTGPDLYTTMPGIDQPGMTKRHYSKFRRPSIAMSELVCKTLDHDAADVLIDKWLEHPSHSYWDWLQRVRDRKHQAAQHEGPAPSQLLLWNKGDFVPENVFSRTVDTGRLIPLDRTWSTHVYHHSSLQDRKLSMMPVVFTMVRALASHQWLDPHLVQPSYPSSCSSEACTTTAATIYISS